MSEDKNYESRQGFLILVCIVSFTFAFLFFLGNISLAKNTSNIPRRTSTPTSAPTATLPVDQPVAWAKYYTMKNMPKDVALDVVETSTSMGDRYLTIACSMDTMWDDDDYVKAAAELIIGVIPGIRDKEGFDRLTFIFYGPFTDKYGNSVQELGIRAMYSRETLGKINTDYFRSYRYSKPEAIIQAADAYMIHPSYQD